MSKNSKNLIAQHVTEEKGTAPAGLRTRRGLALVVQLSFVIASFYLALAAYHPLRDPMLLSSIRYGSAAQFAHGLAAALMCLGWLSFLTKRRTDEKLAAALCLACSAYLAAHLSSWALSSSGRLATQLALALGGQLGGFPVAACIFGWILLAHSWLVMRALSEFIANLPQAQLRENSRAQQLLRLALLSGVFLSQVGLWLLVLLGYASGSPNLLPV